MRTGFIELSSEDVALGLSIGNLRHQEALRQGRADQHGLGSRGHRQSREHELGALGELSVARLWGVDWPAHVNTYKSVPDLQQYEIRTRSQLHYELLIRKDDPNETPFILVHLVMFPHSFNVTGWLDSSEGKRDCFLKTHGGREAAYFIPTYLLKDLSLFDKEHAFSCKIAEAVRQQEADDTKIYNEFRALHGEFKAVAPIERFPRGHTYAGFAKPVNVVPDIMRSEYSRYGSKKKPVPQADDFFKADRHG